MRIVFVCCCALIAALAVAAPAPLPRRDHMREKWLWFAGWDAPVDPVGGCKFHRSVDRLTITMPENREAKGLNVPKLLRTVRGNFAVSVRVKLSEAHKLDGAQVMVGLHLKDAETNLLYGPIAQSTNRQLQWEVVGLYTDPAGDGRYCHEFKDLANLMEQDGLYLRLSRQGNNLRTSVSMDGRQWKNDILVGLTAQLSEEVKVGVFVKWRKDKSQVVFDKFTLTTE